MRGANHGMVPGAIVLLAILPAAGSLVLLGSAETDLESITFEHVTAAFGPPLIEGGVSGVVVTANPADACKPLEGCADCAGKIVLSQRGNCDFFMKVMHAQEVGAVAAIIVNNAAGQELITMSAGDEASGIIIPSVYVTRNTGERMMQEKSPRIMLNATGEFLADVDEAIAAQLDSLVSPFRTEEIMPGAMTDVEFMQSTQLQIMLDVVAGQTTVHDNHFSVYNPSQNKCSSLDGPKCMEIKRKLAALGPQDGSMDSLMGAGIFEVGPEQMVQLQDQLQSALEGMGASGESGSTPHVQAILSEVLNSFGGANPVGQIATGGQSGEGDGDTGEDGGDITP